MFPGEVLTWRSGALETRDLRDTCCVTDGPEYDHPDDAMYEEYFEKPSRIMRTYVRGIEGANNGRIANQPSGGVDSAVIRLLIEHQASRNEAPPIFSYAWEAEREPRMVETGYWGFSR